MLINSIAGLECRIAIVQDGHLEELYIERASSASQVGNIFKARITNVEPSIQAAFVDYGAPKNGFLHISDLHPQYFPRGKKSNEPVGKKRRHRDRPPIQECLRRGQEVVIQMTKEGIGTKGPSMTTYLSIPGRLLVMMPGMSRLGVSRKIEDDQARENARKILADLNPPQDVGFIIRTAGMSASKRDLQRDLNYLLRLWKTVHGRTRTARAPAEVYQESDLVIRTIRDIYNTDMEKIICDDKNVARAVRDFLDVAVPKASHNIEIYTGQEGLFHDFALEEEIEKIYARRVDLKSGGSLVIDQTEALVAIDVNSGKSREHSSAEATAHHTDVEAVREIVRQLRLRDLGGVIVIDFIDLREDKNRRDVEKVLREALRNDRAKTKVLRMSQFGLIEMTRQRMRQSLKDSMYRPCEYCQGIGKIKSQESQALAVMRLLQRACANADVGRIEINVSPQVEHFLSNQFRGQINAIEAATGRRIVIGADDDIQGDDVRVNCINNRGSVVTWESRLIGGKAGSQASTVPIETVFPELLNPPQADDGGDEFSELSDDLPDQIAPDYETTAEGGQGAPGGQEQPVQSDLFGQGGQSGHADQPGHAKHTSWAKQPSGPVSPAARQAGPTGQIEQTGQPGQPGQKSKRKRRGRRGGRKHKKHHAGPLQLQQGRPNDGLPGQPDSPRPDDLPADAAGQSQPGVPDVLSEAARAVRAEQASQSQAVAGGQTGQSGLSQPAATIARDARESQQVRESQGQQPSAQRPEGHGGGKAGRVARRVWSSKRRNNLRTHAQLNPPPPNP